MPRLGLQNSLSKIRDRSPVVLIEEDFTSGTGGFSGTDVTLSNESGGLKIVAGGTEVYATQSFTCKASTKYQYKATMVSAEAGSGDKFLMIGTSAGNAGLIESDTDATSKVVFEGDFTTGGSTTTIHLGLKIETDTKYAIWDDILIEEDDA